MTPPMSATLLNQLAERCEGAKGANYSLDLAIGSAVLGEDTAVVRIPAYTASLDAAMTLVPEGHVVLVANTSVERLKADFTRATAVVGHADDTGLEPAEAATPALALCAAALRARASGVGV